MVDNNEVPFLSHINLSNTGLTYLPNLINLQNLEQLNVNNNNIQTMAKLENASLKELLAMENPIPILDFETDKVLSLTQVAFGSNTCKLVNFSTLQKASTGEITLSIPDQYKEFLIVPPSGILDDVQQIQEYVQCKELSLNLLNTCDCNEQYVSLLWLVENAPNHFSKLNTAHELVFCTSVGTEKVDRLITKIGRYQQLQEIHLNDCGLASVPNIAPLSHLELVDLSYNRIEILTENHLPSYIKKLFIQGNPIPFIKLDMGRFSNLEEVRCGSHCTRFISSQIIDRVHKSGLTLDVPELYASYLEMPPSSVLQYHEEFVEYIRNREKYLPSILNHFKRSETLHWLVFSDKFTFVNVDFTSQKWLFEKQEFSILNLTNVHTLKLDDCGLRQLPNLTGLLRLNHLSLNNNLFKTVPTKFDTPVLDILEIVDNPIEEIDFENTCFPRLTVLKFGSEQTKYVCLRVLNQKVNGNLNFWAPTEYRKYLHRPTWEIIEKGVKSIQRYMSCSGLDVGLPTQTFNDAQWQLDKNEKLVTSFVVQADKENREHLQIDKMLALMQHPSLNCVTKLVITDIGLERLPEWHNLKCLRYADLHGNKLTSVPSSRSLRKLDVSDNMMTTLHFSRNDFPKLTEVVAGSDTMKFISFEVLNSVHVSVLKSYSKSLIMPPYCVLSNDLVTYKENPEKCLKFVDEENVDEAFRWLLAEADFKFTELNLSENPVLFRDLKSTDMFLIGRNVTDITSLELEQCRIDNLPNLEIFDKLERLLLSQNNLADISMLRNKNLQYIDVTNNPVTKLHVNFTNCPKLEVIKAGSESLEVIPLSVLERIVSRKLVIKIDDGYKKYLVLPPPYIIKTDFNVMQLKDYLENGMFDVSWFVEKLQCLSEDENIMHWICNVISKDERRLLSFKICHEAKIRKKLGTNIE